MLKTMSSKKFAKETGLPVKKVKEWCKKGLLPYTSARNGYYIHIDEIID